MSTICGAKCGECTFRNNCRGCEATCGRPFGGTCVAAEYIKKNGLEKYAEFKRGLLAEINALLKTCGIPEAVTLTELAGSFVNMACTLPNGRAVKFLDDSKVYLGTQIQAAGSEFCYGAAADTEFILVCRYKENGTEPELAAFKKR